MRPSTQAAWLSPLARFVPVLAIAAILGGCASHKPGEFIAFEPSIVQPRDKTYYMDRLVNLPLRFNDRWHVDLRPPSVTTGPAVREAHLIRDLRERQNDTLIVVYDNMKFDTLNARDFVYNWRGLLLERTKWNPVMTKNSVFFVNEAGVYQQFNRSSGDLVKKDYYGTGYRPSCQVAGNDTHLIMASVNSNSVHGWPDLFNVNLATAPQVWKYPSRETGEDVRFEIIRHTPIADLEAIYFVSNNNYFYGVNAQTGDFRFRTDLGRQGVVRTPPVIHRDTIYVGSDAAQLFAISRSGEILWTYTADGPIEGPIYAMDDRVYFRTLQWEVKSTTGDKYRNLSVGRTTQPGVELELTQKLGTFNALKIRKTPPAMLVDDPQLDLRSPDPLRRTNPEDPNSPLVHDVDVIHRPQATEWSKRNQGQQVLLKTRNYLFVLFEEWEMPYGREQRSKLAADGAVVKEEEYRIYTKKVLQVLDVNTGEVAERGGQRFSWDVRDFPFIIGSMDESDRAIYFVTKEGHVFKGFAAD